MNKKRILVVDDDTSMLKTLQNILQRKGYAVDTATTGRDAIWKLENHLYDVLLVDIKLPDMKGTDLLKVMNRSQKQVIKIMITGYTDLDPVIESLYQGAHAYILKPVDPDELLKIIKEKLEKQTKFTKLHNEDVMIILEKFLGLLDDKKLWTITDLANALNTSRYRVERIAQFFSKYRLIKYWPVNESVQLNRDYLEITAMRQ